MVTYVIHADNRYLKEDKPHGSAGGLYSFRDRIMEDDPVFILYLCLSPCLIIRNLLTYFCYDMTEMFYMLMLMYHVDDVDPILYGSHIFSC